jgi:hypothetical protein
MKTTRIIGGNLVANAILPDTHSVLRWLPPPLQTMSSSTTGWCTSAGLYFHATMRGAGLVEPFLKSEYICEFNECRN